ncbi:leucyl aminopeptidase [Roseomonas stagni]|uniref:Probable cytosol aminopeptidase n=1 Tax=Falsiroseomonas algicola TaxID=2716930 RepID=A0A6M1LJX0_9PROT|nr:leucyl aminopeptidase [Falsiroseomonas algicola]NGM20620.1 leucyl aminopeptidase [Falsiroseomonas algicola]
MPDIAFVKAALPKSGTLVVPIAEGAAPAGLFAQADQEAGGALARALEAAGFKGRKGQATTLWALGGFTKVVAIGLGKEAELDAAAAEAAGGALVPALAQDREATVLADALAAPLAASLGLGALLRAWRFDRYRTREKEEDKPKLERLAIATADPNAAKQAFAPMRAVADGVFLTRELVSEPPNILHPIEFAERCKGLEKLGVEVEVMGLSALAKLGFGAMIGVAQGSQHEPRLVVMQWKGAPKGRRGAKPMAFIGKGVTFDTGGISIKPAGGMEDMKWDMAGAGTVVGLMAALAGRRAKCDVVGLVGLVENMPSGTAQRPGDVVKTYSGQTVEVINTDAEGRLVLADVIWYAQERFQPRCMIDLATLTGAIIIALGHEHAGLFSNDDELASRILAAGAAVGEKAWRMPLGDAYDKQIRSDIADMKNVGGRPGGSITAAQFIQRFVNTKDGPMPWAHLDIAGTAWSSKDQPTVPKGATAFGVRMLDRLVAEMGEA